MYDTFDDLDYNEQFNYNSVQSLLQEQEANSINADDDFLALGTLV